MATDLGPKRQKGIIHALTLTAAKAAPRRGADLTAAKAAPRRGADRIAQQPLGQAAGKCPRFGPWPWQATLKFGPTSARVIERPPIGCGPPVALGLQ
jgi:hypothetical protein